MSTKTDRATCVGGPQEVESGPQTQISLPVPNRGELTYKISEQRLVFKCKQMTRTTKFRCILLHRIKFTLVQFVGKVSSEMHAAVILK